MDMVIKCITQKYVDFSTRAPRKEFWLFVLCYAVVFLILVGIDISTDIYDSETGLGLFSGIYWFLTLIPYLAVLVRRLHDTNRVGWWVLIALIPLVGAIWLLVLLCLKGDEGENRFGGDPLTPDRNGSLPNISPSSAATDISIKDGSQDVLSSTIPESNNSTSELERKFKVIDDMFERNSITEDEKIKMRAKILGIG